MKRDVKVVLSIVGLFLPFIGMFAYFRRLDRKKKKAATATANGTIINAKTVWSRATHEDDYYWYISYRAGDKEYILEQMERGLPFWAMKDHIGENVTVHYDPDHPEPRSAWAETPGVFRRKRGP